MNVSENNGRGHPHPVGYWVRAAREQVRWYVELRRAYRAEPHAHKRARLWQESNRCRRRRPFFMGEARRYRAALGGIGG